MVAVDLPQVVEEFPLRFARQIRWRIEIEDARFLGTDHGALEQRRQPAVRPHIGAEDRKTSGIGQHAIRGQVLALTSQSVRQPRTDRRSSDSDSSGIQSIQRLAMVIHIGVHRSDQRDVVGDTAETRQQLAQFHSALALRSELEWAGVDLGTRFSRVVVLDLAGEVLHMQLLQFRLGVGHVDMAWPPLHEQGDHRAGLRGVRRLLGDQVELRLLESRFRRGCQQPILAQQSRQRQPGQHSLCPQKVPPCATSCRERSRHQAIPPEKTPNPSVASTFTNLFHRARSVHPLVRCD